MPMSLHTALFKETTRALILLVAALAFDVVAWGEEDSDSVMAGSPETAAQINVICGITKPEPPGDEMIVTNCKKRDRLGQPLISGELQTPPPRGTMVEVKGDVGDTAAQSKKCEELGFAKFDVKAGGLGMVCASDSQGRAFVAFEAKDPQWVCASIMSGWTFQVPMPPPAAFSYPGAKDPLGSKMMELWAEDLLQRKHGEEWLTLQEAGYQVTFGFWTKVTKGGTLNGGKFRAKNSKFKAQNKNNCPRLIRTISSFKDIRSEDEAEGALEWLYSAIEAHARKHYPHALASHASCAASDAEDAALADDFRPVL